VRELETEYAGRVECVIVPGEETAQRADEIERWGFTELRHGLVAFTSGGEPLVKLPGHDYGEPEIRAAIEAVLAAEPPPE